MRADSKNFLAATSENELLAVGLACHHASIAQVANRKSILEIGFIRRWCLSHKWPPQEIFATALDSKMPAGV